MNNRKMKKPCAELSRCSTSKIHTWNRAMPASPASVPKASTWPGCYLKRPCYHHKWNLYISLNDIKNNLGQDYDV